MEQIDLKCPIGQEAAYSKLQDSQKDWFEYEGDIIVKLKPEYRWHNGVLYIPDMVKRIGSFAFKGCKDLTSAIISNGVMSIGESAFCYCTNLKSITLSNSMTSIGHNAFLNCRALTEIKFPSTKRKWEDIRKEYGWNRDTGTYIVHCTDGDIFKNEN